jgi:hypothetical protein
LDERQLEKLDRVLEEEQLKEDGIIMEEGLDDDHEENHLETRDEVPKDLP